MPSASLWPVRLRTRIEARNIAQSCFKVGSTNSICVRRRVNWDSVGPTLPKKPFGAHRSEKRLLASAYSAVTRRLPERWHTGSIFILNFDRIPPLECKFHLRTTGHSVALNVRLEPTLPGYLVRISRPIPYIHTYFSIRKVILRLARLLYAFLNCFLNSVTNSELSFFQKSIR